MNILLLYGGRSGEHEVSCVSAGYIEKNLLELGHTVLPIYVDRRGLWHLQKKVATDVKSQEYHPVNISQREGGLFLEGIKVDFVFPMIHGTTGEDGSLQGWCESYALPYAGCGVLSSALCMDKYFMREIFARQGLPQRAYLRLDFHHLEKMEETIDRILEKLHFPIFTKPCNSGSSVGVNLANTEEELRLAIEDSFLYDDHILVEQGGRVRELEIGILGNYPFYELSLVGEICPRHAYYSYEAKYLDPNGAELKIPAPIEEALEERLRDMAVKAFRAVRGYGFARVDFFLEGEDLYLNEINTLPGFTPISMFPLLFEAKGLAGVELVGKILDLGLKHFAQKEKRSLYYEKKGTLHAKLA
ncbi:MAG: D-alanine--D-alanine ligase [Leptospiraceae bacterium]|nr:D-alanine--D-alanine ligase [Leptospiraceae bacterium]MDW8305904.1 D-alanine--D-alanine ligase family protein [Leptospiraceae bacterium]